MGCETSNTASVPAYDAKNVPQDLVKPPKASTKNEGTIQLDIPVRLQWENHHGYCGQTAIQSCALYYGSYISQIQVRRIAGSEVLIGQNDEKTLDKLGFQFESWDNQSEKPQYKRYLQWIKKHIQSQSPVIIVGYEPEGKNDQYDHIFLATGAISQNFSQYSDQDTLIYTDHFAEDFIHTQFGKIWDTRKMDGNGKDLDFAIPKHMNYGVAILSIKDPEKLFLPVRVSIEENNQPNVSIGQEPATFEATIKISELQQGRKYVLLRYNNEKKIPVDKVIEQKADKVFRFIAQDQTHQINDSFLSNSMAFYRCVEEEALK